MEIVLNLLKTKYADFAGRARRLEYWSFFLFNVVLAVIAGILDAILLRGSPLLQVVVGLALLVPGIAVGFRRMHDIDKSAWWMLIAFVPLVGAIVLIVFALLPGTVGPNRFGPDPKAGASDLGPIGA